MSKAVTPRNQRGIQRRQKLARDAANTYAIYVNPQAKKVSDPDELQRRAHPHLERWYQEGSLKESLLRAVLQYVDDGERKDAKEIELHELIRETFTDVLSGFDMGLISQTAALVPDTSPELTEDELEFFANYLDFDDEG